MNGLAAFTKKEFMECIRSYKLFILIMVFLLLGLMNPVTAKYLPDLIEAFMPEGMNIEIAVPTVMDSWMQFFKNVPQIGMIIIVIVFSNSMATEFHRGTLINVLTKGLQRNAVIISKLLTAVCVWSVSYLTAFFVTYLYNMIFWKDIAVPNLFAAVSLVWLFGVLMLALVMLGSTITKNVAGGLLFAGGAFLIFSFLPLLQSLSKFSPMRLISDNMALLQKGLSVSDFLPCVIVTLLLLAAAVTINLLVFRKKQL